MIFHRHAGQPISVNHLTTFRLHLGEKITTGQITKVLLRCDKCGRPWTQDYQGTWTLDELFPRSS